MILRQIVRLVVHAAVPPQTMRFQSSQNLLDGTRDAAVCVDIVDAQQPLATSGVCVEIAGGRRQERTHVQWAGWRRCEPARGDAHSLAVELFFFDFVQRLAIHALRSGGSGFESAQAYLDAAGIAVTELVLIQPVESLINFFD